MEISHKARFEKYKDTNVITKCTQYAKWTLPQLMAEITDRLTSGMQVLERDYQEIGALLTNNLASKLASLLFPSSRPFFKCDTSAELKKRAEDNGVSNVQLSSGLARMEMDACQQLFVNASYAQLVLMVKYLIVTGNVLLYRNSAERRCTAYGVQSYSVRRDGQGRMLDCVLKEQTFFNALPADIQHALKAGNSGRYAEASTVVGLYTRIQRYLDPDSGRVMYLVSQEADDLAVGTPGVYPEHLCPWQAITWSLLAGEHYGRGLVEDYAGGFARLSDLSQSLALYEVSAMKVLNLVRAGSGADIDALADAECGEYVQGDPDAIQTFEGGEANKIAEVRQEIEAVFSRLARAFMYQANTRDAERVTAFELQQDALEAEKSLGGVYSTIAESAQIPLAHILMTEVSPGILEGIISKDVKLNVIAGIPALGRAADVQNLIQATQEIGAVVPVLVQLDNRIDGNKVADMIYAGKSVDTSILFKSDEQIAQEAAAQQQAQQGQTQMLQAASLADQSQQMQELTQQ